MFNRKKQETQSDNIVDRARELDEAAFQESLHRIKHEPHSGSNPRSPEELDGHTAEEVMAAIDVLAQRPISEGWVDDAAALDPFGIAVAARIGEYVAINSSLEGMGFKKFDSEDEAIRAFHKEVSAAKADPFDGLSDLTSD